MIALTITASVPVRDPTDMQPGWRCRHAVGANPASDDQGGPGECRRQCIRRSPGYALGSRGRAGEDVAVRAGRQRAPFQARVGGVVLYEVVLNVDSSDMTLPTGIDP